MKQFYIFTFIVLFLASCSAYKEANKEFLSGNYDESYRTLISKLQKGLSSKKKAKFLPLVQNAYLKAQEKDQELMQQLALENSLESAKHAYYTLIRLNERQNLIEPFLPLNLNGQILNFPMQNYTNDIKIAKDNYVDFLYKDALALLDSNHKQDIRKSYAYFKKIQDLTGNFKDIKQLMNEAHNLGTDYVLVNLKNKSNIAIPRRLESELLAFNTYGLNDFWVSFHSNRNDIENFDYVVDFRFAQINVSPERERETIFIKEKDIVDGWEYLVKDGETVKDSLGNAIKVDKYVTVKSEIREIQRFKESFIKANVAVRNVETNQLMDDFPLYSEFVFDERYAFYDGDRRAIDDDYFYYINRGVVAFPSNEQMIYDSGMDLKNKLKRILRDI